MDKTRVLVIGMTNVLGGVETFIRNTYTKFDYTKFSVDYLHHSTNGILFEDELKLNGSHIYYCEKFLRHPIKSYKQMKKIYQENKYDVIHCNACSANMLVYFLPVLFMKDKPLIVMHSHNGSSEKKVRHYIFRFILNRIVNIKYACSIKAGEWMYGKKSKYEIISNGIDIDKFRYNENVRNILRKKYNIDKNDIILGSIGRLEKVKNHQFIINFINELPQHYKYVIVGEGSLKNDLIELINNKKVSNRVIILNNTNKVYELYQMFDIFVMPSIFEGLPIVCVEAQVSGLPLILSDNISKDTKLSNNVEFIGLDRQNEWLKAIKTIMINKERKEIIEKNFYNFDNKKVAKRIERDFEKTRN